MKKLYSYLFILLGFASFASCTPEEVDLFSADLGIIFSPMYRDVEVNYYKVYCDSGYDVTQKSVRLMVQLEGRLSDKPASVRLAKQSYKDFPEADIVLPGDSAIEPGKYTRAISVVANKPAEYNKEYKTEITFDYEHSDVVPGILEEQTRVITVMDKTMWEDMEVKNEEEWNNLYASVLGNFGEVKVRFLMAALAEKCKMDYDAIKNTYWWAGFWPSNGFLRYMDDIKEALTEYNASHDKPLAEADGTLVTFP